MKKIFIIIVFLIIHSFSSVVFAAGEEKLIIFDASVSMLEPFEGQPKYIKAINQAKAILKNLPDYEKIGLRTIGVSIDGAIMAFLQNPAELCKATTLEVPIKSNNISAITANLDNIFPLGTTPLEYALSMAVNYDFSSDYSTVKHIILITDGADSCNGDPCRYIQQLKRTRQDIKIDIVAIGVNAEDFKQLNCLTSSTSGTLYNVKSTNELNQAFKQFLEPQIKAEPKFLDNKTIYRNYAFEFNN